MSIFGFLGTSKSHYSSAGNYFLQATEAAGNIVNTLRSALSNIEPQTVKNTVGASLVSWNSYEAIAGKIISSNAAIHLAQCFSTNAELNMAAKATQCAASALVTNPVGCMTGLMATTILAANYEHVIPVVKGAASLTWEAAKTAFYASAAVAETTVASMLYLEENISDVWNLIDADTKIAGDFCVEEEAFI
jgi:hypothetical protein